MGEAGTSASEEACIAARHLGLVLARLVEVSLRADIGTIGCLGAGGKEGPEGKGRSEGLHDLYRIRFQSAELAQFPMKSRKLMTSRLSAGFFMQIVLFEIVNINGNS